MTFDPNPARFDLKFSFEDDKITFHDSSIHLLYWLDPENDAEQTPLLQVTEGFRQNGIDLLNHQLWHFSEMKRNGQAGFVKLMFKGREFTEQLRAAEKREAQRRETERKRKEAGEDPPRERPSPQSHMASSLRNAIIDGDRIQLYVIETDSPDRTLERRRECEDERITALNLDLRYVKARHRASHEGAKDDSGTLTPPQRTLGKQPGEVSDSAGRSKPRTAGGSGRK